MNFKNKITGIIPTFNEELHLEAAINSLSFVDELIVIDSYSTDKTVDIAKAKGVRLVQRKFDDFSSQKNYAIELANYPWVFILDADERVPFGLQKEILAEVSKKSTSTAYWIRRSNFFMKRRIKHSGWKNDKVIRLFKKEECRYNGKFAHEEIQSKGSISVLDNYLDHYTYKDFNSFIRKKNLYAQLQAKELALKGKKANLFHFIFKPSFRFFKHFIFQKGFLDGIEGFFIATFYAYTIFARYVNLWLINRDLK
jgi:glycosyltransferase involved in cell wall biosynthesis